MEASETIGEFKKWFYTTDSSYLFASDRSLLAPEPDTPDIAKSDLLRCPRWIIRHLVVSRRAEVEVEKKWKEVHDQLNQLKLKLNQRDDSHKKDLTIRKQNHGLHVLHKELDSKNKLITSLKQDNKRLKADLEKTKVLPRQEEPLMLDESLNKTLAAKDKVILELRNEIEILKQANQKQSIIQPDQTKVVTPPLPVVPQEQQLPIELEISDEEIPPPPQAEDYVSYAEAKHWIDDRSQRAALTKLLLLEDISFINLLGLIIPNSPERDKFAKHVLVLYQAQGMEMTLLEFFIKEEIQKTKSVNTLFRGEDLPPRLLRIFIRENGHSYVQKVLEPLIKEVSDMGTYLEIDPNRADPSMDLKANFLKLESLAQKFVDAIVSSFDYIPASFNRICKCICDEAGKRFEDSEQLAVAGFIFLRFICPVIATPETFGVTIDAVARRTLLLVGKILQNLANGATFKEDYLQDMNIFLNKNQSVIDLFIKKVKTYPPTINGDSEYILNISRTLYPQRERFSKVADNQMMSKTWEVIISMNLKDRVKKIVEKVCSEELTDASDVVQSYVNTFLDNEALLSEVMTLVVTEKNLQVKKQLAEDLVVLCNASNQIPFLSRIVIQNDISESAYHYLHESFSKYMVTAYCINYGSVWLVNLVGESLQSILSQDASLDVDKASPKREENLVTLKNIVKFIMESIVNNLEMSPSNVWAIANVLSIYTSIDIFQFLFHNFFAVFIETFYERGHNVPGSKDSVRKLQIIADTIRNISNLNGTMVENVKLDDEFPLVLSQKVGAWAKNIPRYMREEAIQDVEEDITKAAKRSALWMNQHMSKLAPLLSSHHTTHTLAFGIGDLMSTMLPPPAEVEEVVETPTTLGSQSMNPKELKKKTKEEEKKKKEEEKRKKKEEKEKKKK